VTASFQRIYVHLQICIPQTTFLWSYLKDTVYANNPHTKEFQQNTKWYLRRLKFQQMIRRVKKKYDIFNIICEQSVPDSD
jgi:hypothetical protein